MGGKAALFLVMGFSLLFMVVAQNFGNISTRAVDNMVDYHDQTVVHNIAVSAANMAAHKIYLDNSWVTGFPETNFMGGTFEVSVDIINVPQNIRRITATGTYRDVTNQVEVTLSPSRFSKFAYYSENEGGIWWTSKDTVWGPFHTQDHFRVSRHPTFYGKATTKKNLIYQNGKKNDYPNFFGGFEKGVNLPLLTDALTPLEALADDDGYKFTGEDTVYLTFDEDSIKIRYEWNKLDTTVLTSSLAPNGVIFAKNSVVRLKGNVKGQYTIGVSASTSGQGKVYLDDNIVYNKDPRTYPNSSDLLGIVAKNHILITQNAANNDDITIHASIYSESYGFGAQNYDTRPVSGDINLLGGIIQKNRQAVGTFSGTTITHGFTKQYKYDDRLMMIYPPGFPGTERFEIVSWLE